MDRYRIHDAADSALRLTELTRNSGHWSSIGPSTASAGSDEEPARAEGSIYTHFNSAEYSNRGKNRA